MENTPIAKTARAITWESDPRAPKQFEIDAFKKIETELKQRLLARVKDAMFHNTPSFVPVENLTDDQLTDFSSHNLVQVVVGFTEYGQEHLFGKVLIPASETGYFHFRAFFPEVGAPKVHAIHVEESIENGTKIFSGIFTKDDKLKYFDT